MNLDEKGLATRRAVLGDAYVDGALAKANPFTAPLQESSRTTAPPTRPGTR